MIELRIPMSICTECGAPISFDIQPNGKPADRVVLAKCSSCLEDVQILCNSEVESTLLLSGLNLLKIIDLNERKYINTERFAFDEL